MKVSNNLFLVENRLILLKKRIRVLNLEDFRVRWVSGNFLFCVVVRKGMVLICIYLLPNKVREIYSRMSACMYTFIGISYIVISICVRIINSCFKLVTVDY